MRQGESEVLQLVAEEIKKLQESHYLLYFCVIYQIKYMSTEMIAKLGPLLEDLYGSATIMLVPRGKFPATDC